MGTVSLVLIALCAFAACAGFMILYARRLRRRDVALATSLQARGFVPAPADQAERLRELPLTMLQPAREGRIANVMSGRPMGLDMLVFDLELKAGDPSSHRTCVLARAPSGTGPGDLLIEHGDLGGAAGQAQVERVPESLRDGYVRVRSHDAGLVERVMTSEMRAYLASLSPMFDFELRDDLSLCIAKLLSPTTLSMQIDALAGFVTRLPRE